MCFCICALISCHIFYSAYCVLFSLPFAFFAFAFWIAPSRSFPLLTWILFHPLSFPSSSFLIKFAVVAFLSFLVVLFHDFIPHIGHTHKPIPSPSPSLDQPKRHFIHPSLLILHPSTIARRLISNLGRSSPPLSQPIFPVSSKVLIPSVYPISISLSSVHASTNHPFLAFPFFFCLLLSSSEFAFSLFDNRARICRSFVAVDVLLLFHTKLVVLLVVVICTIKIISLSHISQLILGTVSLSISKMNTSNNAG